MKDLIVRHGTAIAYCRSVEEAAKLMLLFLPTTSKPVAPPRAPVDPTRPFMSHVELSFVAEVVVVVVVDCYLMCTTGMRVLVCPEE